MFGGSSDTFLPERFSCGESHSTFSCFMVDYESVFKLPAGQKEVPHFFLLSYLPLERKKYCFVSLILQQEMQSQVFLSNVLFIVLCFEILIFLTM